MKRPHSSGKGTAQLAGLACKSFSTEVMAAIIAGLTSISGIDSEVKSLFSTWPIRSYAKDYNIY